MIILVSSFSLSGAEKQIQPNWDFEELLIKPNTIHRLFDEVNRDFHFDFMVENSFNFENFTHSVNIENSFIKLKNKVIHDGEIFYIEDHLRIKNQHFIYQKFNFEDKPKRQNYQFQNVLKSNLLHLNSDIQIWDDRYFIDSFLKVSDRFGVGIQKSDAKELFGSNFIFDYLNCNFEVGTIFSEEFAPVFGFCYKKETFYLLGISDKYISPFPFQDEYNFYQLKFANYIPQNIDQNEILIRDNRVVIGYSFQKHGLEFSFQNMSSPQKTEYMWENEKFYNFSEDIKSEKNRILLNYHDEFFSANLVYQFNEISDFESRFHTDLLFEKKWELINYFVNFEYDYDFDIAETNYNIYSYATGIKINTPFCFEISVAKNSLNHNWLINENGYELNLNIGYEVK